MREVSVEIEASLAAAMTALDPSWWSAVVLDESSSVVTAHRPNDVRSIASVGKLLLLAELDARLADDPHAMPYRLTKTEADAVGDSGVWQHMSIDALAVADLAVLIASVSDNLATNVLLRHLGLDAVQHRAEALGLVDTALHDRVRDERTGEMPTRLASGTASELAAFVQQASDRLLGWMGTNTDHSLIGGGLGLDPLLVDGGPGPLRLDNKTGSDPGVRCDVGRLSGPSGSLSYAVLVNWPDGEVEDGVAVTALQSAGRAFAEFVG